MVKKKITLTEISKITNISRYTIYKVLHGKGHVSEATRNRLMEALELYDYRPNMNARNLAMNKTYKIGLVSMKADNAPYFSDMTGKGISHSIKYLEDHGLQLLTRRAPFDNPQQQIDDIHELIAEGIDGLIITPIDTSDESELKKTLSSLDIPVLFFSRYIPSLFSSYAYVGIDYRSSGKIAGDLLGKMMCEGEQYLVHTDKKASSDYFDSNRYDGFFERISSYKHIQPYNCQGANSLPKEELYAFLVDKFSRSDNQLKGILDMTGHPITVAEAIADSGMTSRITYICFDLFPEIIDFVKQGVIDATVFQDIEGQCIKAIELLFDWLCYNSSPDYPVYNSRLDIIMKENIDYYISEYLASVHT